MTFFTLNRISQPPLTQSNNPSNNPFTRKSSPHPSNAVYEALYKVQSDDSTQGYTNLFNKIRIGPTSEIPSKINASKETVLDKRLAVATLAFANISTQIPRRSTNLSYGITPQLSDPETHRMYSQPMISWRSQDHHDQLTYSTIDKLTIANCHDLSFLVWQDLMDSTWNNDKNELGRVAVVNLVPDHVCVALGQEPLKDEKFPDDFSDWDPNAVICDAWAGIVCPATEYPKVWREKMSEWEQGGLKITLGYTTKKEPITEKPEESAEIECDPTIPIGQWIPSQIMSPTNSQWFNLPDQEKTLGGVAVPEDPFFESMYKKADSRGYRSILDEEARLAPMPE